MDYNKDDMGYKRRSNLIATFSFIVITMIVVALIMFAASSYARYMKGVTNYGSNEITTVGRTD